MQTDTFLASDKKFAYFFQLKRAQVYLWKEKHVESTL